MKGDFMTYTQKIINIGNSLGITLPKDTVNKLKLKAGLPVIVDFDEEERTYRVDPRPTKKEIKKKKITSVAIKPEFESWANTFINKNIDLFKKLAHRNDIPNH
ncbi:hypothetical protein A2773_02195 [Candidatus Gottesmanbacteria bacterium RIFCSPHIGHO2_01_FULL_39_10]|uniref:SpoVT-AbrB domain-containing protein n=1 Tax=Candidatus Gottesmanbacteria bacterium RIFCSPHIGHO2_01_FULL_39_10 TaxID=1798375 RepID=A0A1F5ZQG1_9BACT|nr:MAG: hypothetical protein A2773_02195 [Candidatus Gottesmanbacteria bacterium RIFCSPHIGHO2_01_FULL_39_10]